MENIYPVLDSFQFVPPDVRIAEINEEKAYDKVATTKINLDTQKFDFSADPITEVKVVDNLVHSEAFTFSYSQGKWNIRSKHDYLNRNKGYSLTEEGVSNLSTTVEQNEEFSIIGDSPSKIKVYHIKDKRSLFDIVGSESSTPSFSSLCKHFKLKKKKDTVLISCKQIEYTETGMFKVMFEFPSDTTIYGLGEKVRLRHNQRRSQIWNIDAYHYGINSDNLYQNFPYAWLISENFCNALFFNNHSYQIWESNENNLNVICDSGCLDFFFFDGKSPKDVSQNYSNLTGKPNLPPIWALGYQQCRWSYFPQEKVKEIASKFEEKKISCDVIWLDIDYMDEFRCFTWSKTDFPEPENLIQFLKEKGMQTITMIDPGIKVDENFEIFKELKDQELYVKDENDEMLVGEVWPGDCIFPDFSLEKTRTWWGQKYKKLYVDQNVSGFWNDMNEPALFNVESKTMKDEAIHSLGSHRFVHNIYGMLMAKASYEGLLNLKPNLRPFVLTRSGFSGIQKYAWIWTGDNTSSWSNLKISIPCCLSLSLSGVSGIGIDIGGFEDDCTPELFARFMQIGCFLPLARAHTKKSTKDHEPWSFGEEVEKICKKFISLRYKLLPYWYTQFYFSCKNGIPLVRPLWFDNFSDKETFDPKWENSQFFVGDSILVAPQLWEKETQRKVYLPKGCCWFDFFTEKKYEGGQVIIVSTQLDELPIFVKENTIIPMKEKNERNVEETMKTNLVLKYFGEKSECTGYLYEDDGLSLDYKDGDFKLFILNSDGRKEVK